jgi:mannose/fructose-specific phosphotransferase system component IIA
MVTGIVVTHGKLATALLETAGTVFGSFSDCHAISNSSKTAEAIVDEMEHIVAAAGEHPVVVFVDFYGGSCGYACLKFQQDHARIPIISGVNLPVILAFLNKRDEVPIDTLLDDLIARGHDSIRIVRI